MTTTLMPNPKNQFFDANGKPIVNGKVYTYAAGTSTPKATWADAAGTVPQANPIQLNARGEPASAIYWVGNYKVELRDAQGNLVYSVDNYNTDPIGAGNILPTLAQSSGAANVGFIQSGAGAAVINLLQKARERVSVADFLTTSTPTAAQVATALQAAINSGARRVYISKAYSISAPVTLVANQIIDFDGGSLAVAAGTSAPNGILYASGKENIRIIDPIIDASATSGLGGINLVDCTEPSIIRGKLTKCNVNFQATTPTTPTDARIENCKIDMGGWAATAIYLSGVNGVHMVFCTTCNGKEGIGRYNGATNMIEAGCHHYSHTQDGSIHVKGSKSVVMGNISRNMGQSGFTTQRYTAGTDVQDIVMAGNLSYGHAFDCYDIRGQIDGSPAWGVDMRLVAVGNIGVGSSGCGAYNVLAEGNLWAGNLFAGNGNPGLLANLSPRTSVVGVSAFSNASLVGSGSGKAGVLFQDSPNSGAVGAISTNSAGATHSYGVSFTGTSLNGFVTGGFLQNNAVAPVYLGASSAAAYVTGAAMQTVGNVWTHGVVGNTGAYIESGFGAPSHVRPKGSIFARTDGASGELYTSNGDGTWHSFP